MSQTSPKPSSKKVSATWKRTWTVRWLVIKMIIANADPRVINKKANMTPSLLKGMMIKTLRKRRNPKLGLKCKVLKSYRRASNVRTST